MILLVAEPASGLDRTGQGLQSQPPSSDPTHSWRQYCTVDGYVSSDVEIAAISQPSLRLRAKMQNERTSRNYRTPNSASTFAKTFDVRHICSLASPWCMFARRLSAVKSHLSASATRTMSASPPMRFPRTPVEDDASAPIVRTAGCLVIGDEVLNGKTRDTVRRLYTIV